MNREENGEKIGDCPYFPILPSVETCASEEYKGFSLDKVNGGWIALVCDGVGMGGSHRTTTAIQYPPLATNYSFALMQGSEGKVSQENFTEMILASPDTAANPADAKMIEFWVDFEAPINSYYYGMPDPMAPINQTSSVEDYLFTDGAHQPLLDMVNYVTTILNRDDSQTTPPTAPDDVPCNVDIKLYNFDIKHSAPEVPFEVTDRQTLVQAWNNSKSRVVLLSKFMLRRTSPCLNYAADDDRRLNTVYAGFTGHSRTRTRIFLATTHEKFSATTFMHEFIHATGLWGHEYDSELDDRSHRILVVDSAFEPWKRVSVSACQATRIRNPWALVQYPAQYFCTQSIICSGDGIPGSLPPNCDDLLSTPSTCEPSALTSPADPFYLEDLISGIR